MDYFGITDRGIVRKSNQDVFLCDDIRLLDSALMIVCDGMGGAKSGNIASSMAAECFKKALCDNVDLFGDKKSLAEKMKSAVEIANSAVYDKSISDTDCRGMGTTLVAAVADKNGATIVNVGDSRAYLISRKNGIMQITRDHSVVADMIARGDLTKEQAKHHPNKNLITRAIGTSPVVAVDVFHISL